ncbi:hypothetical protein [Actinocorallia sp. A-T 12471]|uniref:hypothetical protein n=1 Tax=Actinocorallia sp. A-T 12471 TaxID=3089813 RepID=UPI0029CF9E64|nr:hypothetical protein [Actinocorallia sp. A-T 12471]MDX6738676.1 hypothetical protein [Actinocorallia sp. A-T 12471]
MLRLFETRTEQVVGVRPGPLRLYVQAADDLRVCVTADLVRRVASRLRRRSLTTAAQAADHTAYNVPPLDAGDPLPGALGVGNVTSGGDVVSAPWLVPAAPDDPLTLRLALLARHYRAEAALTPADLAEAEARLERWRRLLAAWATEPSRAPDPAYAKESLEALCDDLDVPEALRVLDRLADDPGVAPGAKLETALQLDQILALDLPRAIGTV